MSFPLNLWREGQLSKEVVELLRSSCYKYPRKEGQGQPLLLIPGLWAGDQSLSVMADWLKRSGYAPRRSGIVSNINCSEAEMKRLTRRLNQIADQAGEPAVIIGHSRGGIFAKVLANRNPELVKGIITLGSPLVDPLTNVQPFLQIQLALLSSFGDRGITGLCKHSCLDQRLLEVKEDEVDAFVAKWMLPWINKRFKEGEGCCQKFWDDLNKPFPKEVSFLSIYSQGDGVVKPAACLDAEARHLEVNSSHCGMAVNRQVYKLIAQELKELYPSLLKAA